MLEDLYKVGLRDRETTVDAIHSFSVEYVGGVRRIWGNVLAGFPSSEGSSHPETRGSGPY
jgi:hypothetical protein